jgi:hypothetical protein
MSLRPSVWLLLCQVLAVIIGLAVFYLRWSAPPLPPKLRQHPTYQASRALPQNHLLEADDLSNPDPLSKEDLLLLPKKSELVGRYLATKKQKGDPISMSDSGTRPKFDATPQMVYHFLDLGSQQIPLSLLDAGIPVELSYCANPTESKKECTPTTRTAEIAALLCDSSQPKKCVVALKITKVTETELGHSPASEPVRIFLLGQ